MPETREEAVRREFEKWVGHALPRTAISTKRADGRYRDPLVEQLWVTWQASREAALREAVAAVFKPFSYTAPDSHGVCAICNYYCTSAEKITLASNHYKDCKALALIPVAGKEEKA